MRVAIVGSGGLGGYFGARLAAAGTDVAFVARGKHLAAIRANGLRVRSALGDVTIHPANATENVADIGVVDVAIVAVKLWDTESVAAMLGPLVGPQTLVVSFQNGVEKDATLATAVGAGHRMGGVAYIPSAIGEPGVIVHTGTLAKLIVGAYEPAQVERVNAFADAARAAKIDIEVSDDIGRVTWEKFVFIVGLSNMTALVRAPLGVLRSHAGTRKLLYDVMVEVVAVARARGIALSADFADQRMAFCDRAPAQMSSSMHGDLEKGYRLELPWLGGAVVRYGRESGVATPVCAFIEEALSAYVDGRPA